MSFRVPSLKEARKKQADQIAEHKRASTSSIGRRQSSTPPSAAAVAAGSSSRKRPLPSTSTASAAVGGGVSGSTVSASTTVRRRAPIVNPYAKKKPVSTNTNTQNNASHTSSRNNIQATSSTNGKQGKSTNNNNHKANNTNTKTNHNKATTKPFRPEPIIDDNDVLMAAGGSSTFSQAFRPLQDTQQYHQEIQSLQSKKTNNNNKQTTNQEQEEDDWAIQRAVDAQAAAERKQHESSNADTDALTSTSVTAKTTYLQPHVLQVSTRQRGNPILRHIRNVPYAFVSTANGAGATLASSPLPTTTTPDKTLPNPNHNIDEELLKTATMVPDYVVGTNRCVLFLSLRYHSLHPNYVHRRISEIRGRFDLRILLCLVDVQDNASALLLLNKLAVLNDLTLILAWSEEEAARYIETFKAFEHKDATLIQRREKETFAEQVADVLSAVRSVNKTDAAQLVSQFGSLRGLMVNAKMDELGLCAGVGEKKVRRLFDAFHKPFSSVVSRKRRKERKEKEKREKKEKEREEQKGKEKEEQKDDGKEEETKEKETKQKA